MPFATGLRGVLDSLVSLLDTRLYCYLIMSNARAGSSHFQATLSAIGAKSDFEYALKPYGPPASHQRFLSHGIDDMARDISGKVDWGGCKTFGSKLTLPIYDFLADEEVAGIVHAARHVRKPMHLVRHYGDLLKSNLSRGVAHDFNRGGLGWDTSAAMHKAYSALPGSALDATKPCVFVGLAEAEFKKYIENLVRNDHAFSLVCEAGQGIRVSYESLNTPGAYQAILKFLGMPCRPARVEAAIARPALRKLPAIPDENIPNWSDIKRLADSCFGLVADSRVRAGEANRVFAAQMDEIRRMFS